MILKNILILALILLCTELIFAQEILVSVDTNQALIGERINMRLDVKVDNKTTIEWPVIEETISGLEVIKKSKIDTIINQSEILYYQRFALTSFDTGVYKIDSLMIKFQRGALVDSLMAYPVYLVYHTILLDSTNRYFDIKRPMDIKYNYWFEILMGILGFVIVVALITFLYKKRKPVEKKQAPKILIPGHIIALKKLNVMKEEKVWMKMVIKDYYVDLTDVLREYIQNQHNINAIESTSDEILEDIEPLNLNPESKSKLKELLQMSDLVKFAKIHPRQEEGEFYLNVAIDFVNETKTVNNKDNA